MIFAISKAVEVIFRLNHQFFSKEPLCLQVFLLFCFIFIKSLNNLYNNKYFFIFEKNSEARTIYLLFVFLI